MKWKALFNNRKAVNYTISSVSGNNYIFGFVNAGASYSDVDREYSGIEYAFSKIKINQEDVNKEVKQFLEDLGDTFWLDLGSFKEKIDWISGPTLYVEFIDSESNHAEETDLSTRYASFNLNYHSLTLTDMIGLYYELDNLDDMSVVTFNYVRASLKVAIYQYVWATNWWYRRELLKFLEEQPFNLSYDELERCYIWILKMDWKIPC